MDQIARMYVHLRRQMVVSMTHERPPIVADEPVTSVIGEERIPVCACCYSIEDFPASTFAQAFLESTSSSNEAHPDDSASPTLIRSKTPAVQSNGL